MSNQLFIYILVPFTTILPIFSVNSYQPAVISSSQLDSNAVSSYPFYLDRVNCEGNETNLLQCFNRGVGAIGTDIKSKVSVRCSQNGTFHYK